MGTSYSKIHIGGSLQGAYLPSTTEIPDLGFGLSTKDFVITKQTNKTSVQIKVNGKIVWVKVPKNIKKGQTFIYSHIFYDTSKIIASTLPTAPGHEIVKALPIVYASISRSFYANSDDQQSMGNGVGSLLQEAQEKILEQVCKARCNACLGMTFNVTNDSSGERGQHKMIIVTVCGTPCVVLPTSSPPTVIAEAVVDPLYSSW